MKTGMRLSPSLTPATETLEALAGRSRLCLQFSRLPGNGERGR